MSTGSYTGNVGVKGIFPLPDPSDTGCFRFTAKSTTGCERMLYEQYWQEQISLYGQQVSYYVNNYNTLSADNFYGEQPTQQFSLPQTIIMAVNLNENALLMSKYGLLSDDEITAFVPYSAFYVAYGAAAEPKSGDVFALSEYGNDRPGNRGPNYYEVTQRLDQDIAQINPLMGHYVWLIKAKRFEYSFEPGLSGEQANQQVYDDAATQAQSMSANAKPYTYDVDNEVNCQVFNYQYNDQDDVYGGYINTFLVTFQSDPIYTFAGGAIDLFTPNACPNNIVVQGLTTFTDINLYSFSGELLTTIG